MADNRLTRRGFLQDTGLIIGSLSLTNFEIKESFAQDTPSVYPSRKGGNKTPIIDFHTHYCPKEIYDKSPIKMPPSLATKLGDRMFNIERRLEEMDIGGIDIAVLTNPLVLEADLEICKLNNNLTAQMIEKYPDRLTGLAHIPVTGGKKALEEFHRAIKDLNLKGLGIGSWAGDNLMLDSKSMWPIYEKASELNVPIWVHPRPFKPIGYEYMKDYDFTLSLGHDFDLTFCVARLINGRVFQDFPGLKIVVAHLGGATPVLLGRLRLFQDREIWGENPSFVSIELFDQYYNKIFFDTGGFGGWINALKSSLFITRPQRILFGTDYPPEIREGKVMKRFIESIKELEIDNSARQGILGENALRILG